MNRAWSIATSNRKTSCSKKESNASRSPTSAWLAPSMTPRSRARARSPAHLNTCHPNRHAENRSIRKATCSAWEVCLYALCTGRPPFRADTSYGVMRRISDESPTPIRELNPDIPRMAVRHHREADVEGKENRFESASEVHELLDACLSHVQQPTNVPLPHQLLPQFEANRAKRSLMPQTLKGVVMLTAIIVLGISGLGLLGIRGCDGDKHSDERSKSGLRRSSILLRCIEECLSR